jgi:hypothetical protein
MSKLWTAVSYNWSSGTTQIQSFVAPADFVTAEAHFEETWPWEDLLALVPGQHAEHSKSFPLTKWVSAATSEN